MNNFYLYNMNLICDIILQVCCCYQSSASPEQNDEISNPPNLYVDHFLKHVEAVILASIQILRKRKKQ